MSVYLGDGTRRYLRLAGRRRGTCWEGGLRDISTQVAMRGAELGLRDAASGAWIDAIDLTVTEWYPPTAQVVDDTLYVLLCDDETRVLWSRELDGTSEPLARVPGACWDVFGAMDVSRDGATVVFGSQQDGDVHVVDTSTGAVRTIEAHARLDGSTFGIVGDAALSPSGQELLTVGADERLRRWSVATGELLEETAATPSEVNENIYAQPFLSAALAWSEDGRFRVTQQGDDLRIDRTCDGEPVGYEATALDDGRVIINPDTWIFASSCTLGWEGPNGATSRTWDRQPFQLAQLPYRHDLGEMDVFPD